VYGRASGLPSHVDGSNLEPNLTPLSGATTTGHPFCLSPFGLEITVHRWLSPPSTASVCPVTNSDAFRK
jgi:hypothetical protein